MVSPVIEIKRVKIVGGYEFNDVNCELCKNNLMAPYYKDIEDNTKKNVDMRVSVGKCGHIFHKKCITEFRNSGILSCPLPSCKISWNEESQCNCDL